MIFLDTVKGVCQKRDCRQNKQATLQGMYQKGFFYTKLRYARTGFIKTLAPLHYYFRLGHFLKKPMGIWEMTKNKTEIGILQRINVSSF